MRALSRPARWLVAVWVCLLPFAHPRADSREEGPGYENLRVLPKTIGRDELGEVMLDILRGLGLPRRAGEGCLYCHAGSLDVPRSDWDYASDEKPMKQKARVMLQMVRDVNRDLATLSSRSDPPIEVGCYTCHAARTHPMPLLDLLLTEYETGGVDALAETYRHLRDRYFASDAYDFRMATLARVADRLVGRDAYDAAAAVHELNIEYYDEPGARGGLIRLRMLQALESGGVDAMVARYHALKDQQPASAFTPMLLGPLSWGLFRGGERDAGFRLFELGFEEFPDNYFSTENLAWGCESMGDHDRAIELAERWLAGHPDHELGLRLLRELRQAEDD